MAFASTMEWDVSTTGDATNGGGFDTVSGTPGTNYANQNSPQVTYTDLVIDGTTNTKCTSAATPFTSAHVGNVINITSGTGFTVQRVQIMSVTAAVATCDKSLGTLSSTGGNGKLGGALLTIAAATALGVTGNTVWVKAGTYTITATIVVNTGLKKIEGFAAAHGDFGTQPLITTATNGVSAISIQTTSVVHRLVNLSMSRTAGTAADGIRNQAGTCNITVDRVTIDGFRHGIQGTNGIDNTFANITCSNTEIKNCSGSGINCDGSVVSTYNCSFHGNTTNGIAGASSTRLMLTRSLFYANAFGVGGGSICNIVECVFYGNSLDGLALDTTYGYLANCIIYGNGRWGISNSLANVNGVAFYANAFGANTSGNLYAGMPSYAVAVSLSANPFTNAASGDFSLNSTAGGGTACKAVAVPGVYPGGLTTSSMDIGAVQTASAAGGSGGSFCFIGV